MIYVLTGLLFNVHDVVGTDGVVDLPDEQKTALFVQPHLSPRAATG